MSIYLLLGFCSFPLPYTPSNIVMSNEDTTQLAILASRSGRMFFLQFSKVSNSQLSIVSHYMITMRCCQNPMNYQIWQYRYHSSSGSSYLAFSAADSEAVKQ